MLKGFLTFVREQGVVGIAVGIAIGLAATETVQVIVKEFINPLVGWILSWLGGAGDLVGRTWVVAEGDHALAFKWGAILNSVIALLATAFVVYWLVHKLKLDRLDKKKDD